MPPKAKYSKEEIVKAALEIARVHGIGAVSAREVGALLHSSARPIFTYFESMEDLKKEVREYARQINENYIKRGLTQKIPFLGVGLECIRFAKEEPELYKLLYLTKFEEKEKWDALSALEHTTNLVTVSIQQNYHMSETEARNYYRDMWLLGHSFATLIVTGTCHYTDEQIEQILAEVSLSICKAYKEIPGLVVGEYDKDEVFRGIIGKPRGE